MMHQPVCSNPPRLTMSWERLYACFDPQPLFDGQIQMWEWVLTRFRVDALQRRLDDVAWEARQAGVYEAVAPKVPADWATSGYADKLECDHYAREIADRLRELGVDVTTEETGAEHVADRLAASRR